jgi:hypothetical protein
MKISPASSHEANEAFSERNLQMDRFADVERQP